jgi:Zn-dependent protease
MIYIPGKIPIAIHPFFWLFAALIGWLNSGSFLGALIWVGIIFFSVLLHEFGHALTAVAFRQTAKIQLVALGGLTSYEGPKLKFWQQFIIVFNGPLFGFLLYLAATFALYLDWSQQPLVYQILRMTQIANLFWSIVNLLPVLPLDGGQLLRIVLEAFFGIRGYKAALLLGAILSGGIAGFFFLIQAYLVGAFFFLFAFQSFDLWRKSRAVTAADRDDDLRKLLEEGEKAYIQGNRADAATSFQKVLSKTRQGLIAMAAMQYLALIDAAQGRRKEAYDLLLPIEAELAEESKVLLHELAAECGNWELVARLSAECYQTAPSQKAALYNARAFASLKQPQASGGWLQTAWQFGGLDLEKVLSEAEFQVIRQDEEFRKFTDPLR